MTNPDRSVFTVEGVTARHISDHPSDPRNPDYRCSCCGGGFHVYGAGINLINAEPLDGRTKPADRLSDWVHEVAYAFRLRPGTRVRVTVEEIQGE